MKPLPKTSVPTVKVRAPVRRRVAAALEALDEQSTTANAEAVLAAAASLPVGADRVDAEWQALQALVDLGELADARRAWETLAASWSEHAPFVDTAWAVLARTKDVVGAKIPAKLRTQIRTGWAWGILSQTFEYRQGTSKPRPPADGAGAWAQGCIEITLQSFERARACVDAVHAAKGFEYSATCLDIMLRREQGDAEGARASYHELVALARKKRSYAQWDVIAALYVILGVDDTRLAKDILGAWAKRATASTRNAASIFAS